MSMFTLCAEEILGISGVDFYMAIIIFCIHQVLENNGNRVRQCISCLETATLLMIQLEGGFYNILIQFVIRMKLEKFMKYV
jgi:hypothetical protein